MTYVGVFATGRCLVAAAKRVRIYIAPTIEYEEWGDYLSAMMHRLSYEPVGQCIYCLSTKDLTIEHIIPFSLGGQVKLPAASCQNCAIITSAFEHTLSRTMYGNLRIRRNFPTRRRAKRPILVRAHDAVTGAEVWLSPEESVTMLPAVHFLPPGILRDPPEEPINWVGATFEAKQINPTQQSRWPELGSNSYTFAQTFDADALALTLAKIAHAYVVAEFGLSNFEPFLPPVILGKQKSLFKYVGGSPTPLRDPDQLHSIRLHLSYPYFEHRADWLLLVSIGLLSAYDMPTALIVVGRANKEWALNEDWRRGHRESV